jgi:hypothetical protein
VANHERLNLTQTRDNLMTTHHSCHQSTALIGGLLPTVPPQPVTRHYSPKLPSDCLRIGVPCPELQRAHEHTEPCRAARVRQRPRIGVPIGTPHPDLQRTHERTESHRTADMCQRPCSESLDEDRVVGAHERLQVCAGSRCGRSWSWRGRSVGGLDQPSRASMKLRRSPTV